jgi:hypothetical protein
MLCLLSVCNQHAMPYWVPAETWPIVSARDMRSVHASMQASQQAC